MVSQILYYTDNRLDKSILGIWVKKILQAQNLPIVSVSLKPIDLGQNIHYYGRRSHSTMFKQILVGLRACTAENVFMCEHDVLYHPSHFEFVPPKPDVYYYNNNCWKFRLSDMKVIGYDCKWLSQNCSNRKILIEHYENKLKSIEEGKRAYGYEPGTGQSKYLTPYKAENWESRYPNLDVRHGKNWTGVKRMDPDEFRDKKNCQNWQEISIKKVPGWSYQSLSLLATKSS